MYGQLTMPLFVSGYIALLDTVKPGLKEVMLKHLRELMADADTYRWELIRANHVVWLQQLENGRANWVDTKCK